jgi:hypothetical protein
MRNEIGSTAQGVGALVDGGKATNAVILRSLSLEARMKVPYHRHYFMLTT